MLDLLWHVLRLFEYYALKIMRSCSNVKIRPCSNTIKSTTVENSVAKNVAIPKHIQDTLEYLVDNLKKEENTEPSSEHVENILVRVPLSDPNTTIAYNVSLLSSETS